MTPTHRDNIPFFSDLPAKAIPAAARLWDAIQNPAYNGVVAYNDFVQDVTALAIAAPPRAVVKRWQAGVEAGLIARPGDEAQPPVIKAKPSEIVTSWAYFDTLPATAMPALDEAWSRASADGFSDDFIFSAFRKSLSDVGHAAPTKGQFGEWLKAVRAGQFPRPGTSAEEVEAPFEKLTPETFSETAFDALRNAGVMPLLPGASLKFIQPPPDPALIMIRDRMVEEMVAHLTANARATAEAMVADRFRQIAETMAVAS